MTANILTQDRLKEILHYDPETGIFTRRKNQGGIKAGSTAGNVTEQGYIRIKVDRKLHYAQRLVWLYVHGHFPEDEMDHINHIRDDNRLINLRKCSRLENMKNKSRYKCNSSGRTGISWHKRERKWHARIRVNKKIIHLGSFKDIDDAVKSREEAEELYKFHENHGKEKGLPKQPL